MVVEMQSSEGQGTPVTNYAFKASLMGSAHRFELTGEGLSWHIGARAGLWRYGDITAIGLSYRPISLQRHRFRADIRHVSGRRMTILSTTWQTVTLMAAQDRDYRGFIAELHARLAQAGGRPALRAGLGQGVYAVSAAMLALLAAAMAGLFIRALTTGEVTGALFIVGFAALFAWEIGGFVRRNRPRSYGFDRLPDAVLP